MLGVACLLSVPAVSGENPWDADGGGGNGTGSPLDTIISDLASVNAQTAAETQPLPPADNNPSWVSRAMTRMSHFMIEHFFTKTSKKAQPGTLAF
jgi:hypothetical protein